MVVHKFSAAEQKAKTNKANYLYQKENSKLLTIRFYSPDYWKLEALKDLAQKNHTSVAGIVKGLIDPYLEAAGYAKPELDQNS